MDVPLRYRIGTSLSNHKSAILNVFKDYGVSVKELQVGLVVDFSALKRREVREIASGTLMEVKIGKDPIDFAFFLWLANKLLGCAHRSAAYLHCSMVFSWVLMARDAAS